MSIDWSIVSVEHVQQACEYYDRGIGRPTRAARSTLLQFNGKSYPAKYIRGLAYRIATGVELDPNTDYAGGDETIRFFVTLGLQAVKTGAPVEKVLPPPVQPVSRAEPVIERTYEPQKQALYNLLKQRFKVVETEAKFPWLAVPDKIGLVEPLRSIFIALEAMRGFSGFAVPGQSLRCDFFIPGERLIVEYDERQHFTLQRATVLELYPADLPLGFDRQEWTAACRAILATDAMPPHRDEQRAFYDASRDILAAANGYRLVRFRQGTIDWTNSDAESHWAKATGWSSPAADPPAAPALATAAPMGQGEIGRIALVSHDYNSPDSRGIFDYSEHFDRINRVCAEQGCDTILYALWTWNSATPTIRTHASMFSGTDPVRTVVLEVYDPPEQPRHVEVWRRGHQEPFIIRQRFATSSASAADKQQFMEDLPARRFGSALLMICGETNICSLVRGADEFYDPFGFAGQLTDSSTKLILNPIHDYMRRYEMREKRRFYSQQKRTVVSVWNQGKKAEAPKPWTVFHDGHELTDQVREVDTRLPHRPDIRIGIFDVSQ